MWIIQAGRVAAIVDKLDNLKTNCPQCPQIQRILGKGKGRGRKSWAIVDKLDNVDNLF
jgi:transposase-like protein